MSHLKELKIFVASPGEVEKERTIIDGIINELNDTISKTYNLYLRINKWEKVTPEMGRPQEVINKQIKPNECDIFIGVLWTKFGSKTGNNSAISANQFYSGTEEEFELAYNTYKDKGFPFIMFYKSDIKKEISGIDPSQLQKVKNFFKRFKQAGKTPGIYSSYTSLDEFSNKIRHDLLVCIDKLFPVKYDEENPILSEYYNKNGFVKLFLPQNNSARTINKLQILRQAKFINLIAETGHAYLALTGHRYRDEIEQLLKSNFSFKIILSNPFSISGLLKSFSDAHYNSETIINLLNLNKQDVIVSNLTKLFNDSKWFNFKFKNSLEGYKLMKEKYPDFIHLKFTKLDIPASIAVTDKYAFFEPYLNINTKERDQKDMMTFDIQVSNESRLYHHLNDYFNSFWELSEEIDIRNVDIEPEINNLLNYLNFKK